MKAHLTITQLLVPRSVSSAQVKVKYQGHVSQKMGVSGALVFHKHVFHKHILFVDTFVSFLKREVIIIALWIENVVVLDL